MGRLDGTVGVAAAWGKTIALFLASEESRMIAGAAIPADGGSAAY